MEPNKLVFFRCFSPISKMGYLQVSMFVFGVVYILLEATPGPTKVESKGLSWENPTKDGTVLVVTVTGVNPTFCVDRMHPILKFTLSSGGV